jgi:hypothetical protein
VEKCSKAGQATVDNVLRRMPLACWITNATDTHSECTFPRQQWLHEGASMGRLRSLPFFSII